MPLLLPQRSMKQFFFLELFHDNFKNGRGPSKLGDNKSETNLKKSEKGKLSVDVIVSECESKLWT